MKINRLKYIVVEISKTWKVMMNQWFGMMLIWQRLM